MITNDRPIQESATIHLPPSLDERQTLRQRNLRIILLVTTITYFLWWFAVNALLPAETFNPLASRLVVCGILSAVYLLSLKSSFVQNRMEFFFPIAIGAAVTHYFYLFYYNAYDVNWTLGAYITVLVAGLCYDRRLPLLIFTGLVLAAYYYLARASAVVAVGLPGMITLLILLNIVAFARNRFLRLLQDLTNRYTALFDGAREGLALIDQDRIIDVNWSMQLILGKKKTALIGEKWRDVLKLGRNELHSNQIIEIEYRRGDGLILTLEMVTSKIVISDVRFQLMTLLDITDRKKVELERRKAEQAEYSQLVAESISNSKNALLNNVSHELRTPLTAIIGFSDILKKDTSISPQQQVMVKRINDNGLVLLTTVEKLITIADSETSGSMASPTEVNFASYFENIIAQHRELAETKHLMFSYSIDVSSPNSIYFAADSFKAALDQVLDNSVKFTSSGSIVVSVSFEQVASSTSGSYMLTCMVQDTGIGISKSLQSAVFSPFSQQDQASTRRYGGMGTGLAYARKLARTIGGDLTLQKSVPDHGTLICLSVPVFERTA